MTNRYIDIAQALINILHEKGRIVKITQPEWNIYDAVADRLHLSPEDRTRLTRGGNSALRASVGFVKAALKNERIISDVPGEQGVWTLQEGHERGIVWLMTMNQEAF